MAKSLCTSELRPLTLMRSNKDGVIKRKGGKQFSCTDLHIYHPVSIKGSNKFCFSYFLFFKHFDYPIVLVFK
jgi:hypothetical protein